MKVVYVVMTCRLDLEVTLYSLRDVLCAGNPQTVAKSCCCHGPMACHGLHQGISRGDVGHLGPGSRDARAAYGCMMLYDCCNLLYGLLPKYAKMTILT